MEILRVPPYETIAVNFVVPAGYINVDIYARVTDMADLSVQDLEFLDEWCFSGDKLVECKEVSIDERAHRCSSVKDVFKTFKEINQLDLVRQAGIRQQYIDQAVSLNLAFPAIAEPKWINQVTMEAWKQGVKTLYYMRTESVLRGDIATKAMDPECVSCEG